MKKNLKFYSHMVNSHNHWKFRTLRRKFGWAGEGRFWALNNLIAESDYCRLDLSDEDRKMAISVELDFDPNEFQEFLDYLEKTCKLIWSENGCIMTDKTQENFHFTDGKRAYNRERKSQIQSVAENQEVVAENQNTEKVVAEIEKVVAEKPQTKLKETKLKETKQIQGDFSEKKLIVKLPFETDTFAAAWNDWKVYKKVEHKFSYKSPTSEQAGLENLKKLSGGDESTAIAIIQRSLSNCWKGFFELPNNFKKNNHNGQQHTSVVGKNIEFDRP